MEWIAFWAFGMGVGGVSGILGIGGGVLIIPGLMTLFGFDQNKASGTSLAVLTLPVCLLGAFQYYREGRVDIGAASGIAVGYALGIFITAGFVSLIPTAVLSQLFGALLLCLGVKMVVTSDRGASVVLTSCIALLFAWFSFIFLRWAGKKYQVKPYLNEIVKRRGDTTSLESDYHI
jgi:uncharacterized membrane protein YfcA